MSDRKNIFTFIRGNKALVTFMVCFLLATGIWVINSLNNSHSTTVRIPVVFDLPAPVNASLKLPEYMELHIKGRGFTLFQFISRSKRFKIRPFEKANISNDTVVSSIDVIWPLISEFGKEIEVTRVSPDKFFLSGNNSYSKKLPVKGTYTLNCKPSFIASGPSVYYPDSVYIFSSKPIPDHIREINAEPVSIDQADQQVFRRVNLQLPGNDFHLSSRVCWLYIPVEAGTEIRLEVPVISKNKMAAEVFIPNYVKVTCMVPLSKFTATKPSLFSMVTEASDLNTDKVLVRMDRAPYWAGKIRWEPSVVTRFVKNIN